MVAVAEAMERTELPPGLEELLANPRAQQNIRMAVRGMTRLGMITHLDAAFSAPIAITKDKAAGKKRARGGDSDDIDALSDSSGKPLVLGEAEAGILEENTQISSAKGALDKTHLTETEFQEVMELRKEIIERVQRTIRRNPPGTHQAQMDQLREDILALEDGFALPSILEEVLRARTIEAELEVIDGENGYGADGADVVSTRLMEIVTDPLEYESPQPESTSQQPAMQVFGDAAVDMSELYPLPTPFVAKPAAVTKTTTPPLPRRK